MMYSELRRPLLIKCDERNVHFGWNLSTMITPCKEISLKKISFTHLKIIGVIILESCQDLQIYLKFGFKSRTWIVIFNVRSWRVVYPREKKRFMEISFNWLFYKYLPQFLSFKLFLQPPPPSPISDRYIFLLSGKQIISLTYSYWWNTCADLENFFQGEGP